MPKSSTDSATPRSASRCRSGSVLATSLITEVSVISNVSASGGTPVSASSSPTITGSAASSSPRTERLTATLMCRPASSHARHCCRATRSTTAVSGRTSPVCSASGTKSSGRQHAQLGVLPAHQRFHPDHGTVTENHLRLVEDAQLIAFERAPQLADQGQAPRAGGVEHRLPHLHRPRVRFRRLHGDRGPTQQAVGVERRCRDRTPARRTQPPPASSRREPGAPAWPSARRRRGRWAS